MWSHSAFLFILPIRTLPGSPFFEMTRKAEMHMPPCGTVFILGGRAPLLKAANLRSVVMISSLLAS